MTTLLPIALSLLLQSTTLLLLGLMALRLARRRGPAVQSLIGRATLAGVGLTLLLSAPLTGHVRPLWRVTLPTGSSAAQEPTPPRSSAPQALAPRRVPKGEGQEFGGSQGRTSYPLPLGEGGGLPPGGVPSLSSPLGKTPVTEERGNKELGSEANKEMGSLPYPTLAACWGLGTAFLLLWLGVCQCHITRLRRTAHRIASGPAAEMLTELAPRPPALLAHPSVRSPFLAGLRHPAIFLPAAHDTDFSPAALRAILAHELAHLARRDTAWTLAARLLCALLWPQPLLWVLCRRLEQIGEEACDQAVLAQDCPPRAYADCLLTLAARHPLGRRERALGAGVAPFRSSLGRRIGRILDKGTHAMSTVTLRLRLTIAALTVAAALGGAFLISSAPAQSPAPATAAPTLEQQRLNATRLQDMSNLKQIGLALTQYAQDHDEHFPNAAHWMDALSPYLKDKTVFFDPFQPEARHYGYALNRNCSGKSLAFFDDPQADVMVFDSTLGTRNASDTGQSLRATVLLRLGGIPGSSYLFMDGHVKWFSKAYLPSFAIRPPVRPGYGTRRKAGQPQASPAFSQVVVQSGRKFMFAWSASHPDPELSNARFLAGLTPVQGPGVVVTLNDSKQHLPKNMPPGMAPPNIIHDSDINQVVNELKAAGAEAIAVNDQRLVATSPIRCVGPIIFVNGVPQAPPFAIKAIGDPKTLAAAMNLPGGIATQLNSYDPLMFSVREVGTLTLPAYSEGKESRFAKPMSGVSMKNARGQASVAFLNAQIEDVKLHLREAEKTLSDYEASHRILTPQTQRKLADLTRNYSSLQDLYTTLVKKREELKQQRGQDQGASPHKDDESEALAMALASKAAAPQPSTSVSEQAALLQQRDQLEAHLHALNEQAAALAALTQTMWAQAQQTIKKLPNPGASTGELTHIERQAIASQLMAAQADLNQKEATLTPQHPAVIAAKRKVQSLEKVYREQPIREKFQFAKEVHQYIRRQVVLINAVANQNNARSRLLSSIHERQGRLQSSIDFLNAQIARHNASAPEH